MDNTWRKFAEINGMSQEDFFNEVITTTMAIMSMRLEEQDSNAIKITKGNYTLMLIDNDK